MSEGLKIAAVFATMNRGQTAVACVRALAAQTRAPEMVVVADNVSSDDTVALLEGLVGLPFELVVHRMPENAGNAGGVRAAMELAYAYGADGVWILDDDSWPRPEALAALMEHYQPEWVVHPLQIDPRTDEFTWPLQVVEEGEVRLVERLGDLPSSGPVRTRGVWTGALVSRWVRDKVGPVNGDLFIRGEDEEYPWRMERAGVAEFAVRGAGLDHPGPRDLVVFRFAGRRLYLEAGLVDWKLYYKVRNMVWLKRQQSGVAMAMGMAMAYAAGIARVDGAHRLNVWAEAFWDGMRGRLGRWERS